MRIAFTGAQGTGKSTLAERAASEYRLPILSTPGRLMAARGLPVNQEASVTSQALAWLLQLELEGSEENWIATRCLIDIWAYAVLAAERHMPAQLERELLQQLEVTTGVLLKRRYDALFYLPPRIPLQADDVRSDDLAFQRETDETIRAGLSRWDVEHVEIDVTDPRAEGRLLDSLRRLEM